MMFVRDYDTKFCDIDKDSYSELDRNCRLKGTIAAISLAGLLNPQL